MSGKSLQRALMAKKWLYIDKLAHSNGMIVGPHIKFSKSMQIFCDLCYGNCNLFRSSPLLTYTFYLKSVQPCLIPISFTVFCCMVGVFSSKTYGVKAIYEQIPTLIWKDLGFLKKSANKPTLEPFFEPLQWPFWHHLFTRRCRFLWRL